MVFFTVIGIVTLVILTAGALSGILWAVSSINNSNAFIVSSNKRLTSLESQLDTILNHQLRQ